MALLENNYINKKFTRLLLKWNLEKNNREMPWKNESDPYKIWLSEIILQQTRVEQGLGYYLRFIQTFPTIHHLARAKDEKIFKLWEGLGYYNRCRNLITTGRYISKKKNGKFPESFAELKTLKGIGPYTAAAIASFAYNLPHAVVDGNVLRVLSRISGISQPIDSARGKKIFNDLADRILDKKQPGIYNQSIMDFGAMVCKPLSPLCKTCPCKKICYAFNHDLVNQLPVKEKKAVIKNRWFYYLILENKNDVVLRQRTRKDIWKELFEFPVIESAKEENIRTILLQAEKKEWIRMNGYSVTETSKVYKQKLTHQLIYATFTQIRLKQPLKCTAGLLRVRKNKLTKYAFPKIVNSYLNKMKIF